MLHEFGLQLTLKAHSWDIRTLEDVMVCFIHWRLLRYGFICMGDGPSPNNIPTEILPINLGWDGDLRGYFLKYQVRRKQYLLSVNLIDEMNSEIGLLSDSMVTKVTLNVQDLVWDDFQINRELAADIAFTIDTDLIQPQGFARVDEKWLTDWDDRASLLNQDDQADQQQMTDACGNPCRPCS